MTSSMLRRQLKNLVQNYSEAEVKVREATSNDPWGPSSSQMADISDLTYNTVACNEIMTMLWKRLKDDKNWRHIHKSLTLLEYLLKTGDDRVLLKMKDNIYIVKALTEYRYVEKDGKDQGANVREKAKVVLVLMEDDEKLKAERDFAVKTREKTSKSSAASSADDIKDPNYKPRYVSGASGLPSLDNIPSVADLTASFAARKEERLRQEAEKKETERRAKMSEDELKWEDAGKVNATKDNVWGGEKEKEEEEEAKPGPWGASKEPSSDAWGAPTKTEDPFAAEKTDEDSSEGPKGKPDPFTATKDDPFNTPKDSTDPFSAPKKTEDPFAAPKDKPDPFSSSNGDPFNAPKDDPFTASKDDPFNAPKDDPFNAPKDDPFNAPKDDPFNAPKDDPFNAPKDDPFNAPKDDPFNAPKDDPFNAPKDDPFNAPKDDPFTASTDDPFNAPKDDPFNSPKDDPFNSPKDDPFTAPKDDPFTAPKDDPFTAPKDDPFTAPKDDPFTAPKDDPFNAPKDDPFTAPKDDPFTAPKDDPFTAPKDDPFNAPKDDPFNAPKDDQFNAPKDDPFNAPKDDQFNAPKEDPFSVSKTDPFTTSSEDNFSSPQDELLTTTPPKEEPSTVLSKDDPFNAATTPPEDSFPASTKTIQDDPFAAPTTPPKEDPFSTELKSTNDDPFGAPSAPLKEDPFTVPPSSSKDDASDPFSAPSSAALTSSPPATGSDAWGAPSAPKETKATDPWGDGSSASSLVDNSDPFGDASKSNDDPWGTPASVPVSTDDAWGTPAQPSDLSPSDPFGDGKSKANDPWGAGSSASGNSEGKRTLQEDEMQRKTASFLGSAGASLVDLDDLFSSNPKPRQYPLKDWTSTQTQATGAIKAKGMACGPVARSGAFPEASDHCFNPFSSSLAPTYGAISSGFGTFNPSGKTPLFQKPSDALGMFDSGVTVLQGAQVTPQTGMAPPMSIGGNKQMAPLGDASCGGVGMMQLGYPGGNPLGMGDALTSFFERNHPAGLSHIRGFSPQSKDGGSGLDETTNKNNNPFLD